MKDGQIVDLQLTARADIEKRANASFFVQKAFFQ